MWAEFIVVTQHEKKQSIWRKAFPIFSRASHKYRETTARQMDSNTGRVWFLASLAALGDFSGAPAAWPRLCKPLTQPCCPLPVSLSLRSVWGHSQQSCLGDFPWLLQAVSEPLAFKQKWGEISAACPYHHGHAP